jgi:hypothetical protein
MRDAVLRNGAGSGRPVQGTATHRRRGRDHPCVVAWPDELCRPDPGGAVGARRLADNIAVMTARRTGRFDGARIRPR